MSASKPSSTSIPAPSSAKMNSKSTKQSKRIILHLSPSILAKFPSAQPIRKAARSKVLTLPATPTDALPQDATHDSVPVEFKPEPVTTPASDQQLEASTPVSADVDATNSNGDVTPKTQGVKRQLGGIDANGQPKQKARPGPKKRARIDGDGTGAVASHHKLGPRANQGAINAGLRALDRSGKQCRKWDRKGFQLKSFTGVTWNVPSWRTPKRQESALNGDVKSETTGSSDAKPENGSCGLQSEKSNSGGENVATATPIDMASSPAPVVLAEMPAAS